MQHKEIYDHGDLVKIQILRGVSRTHVRGKIVELVQSKGYFVYSDFESGKQRIAPISDIVCNIEDKVREQLRRIDVYSII